MKLNLAGQTEIEEYMAANYKFAGKVRQTKDFTLDAQTVINGQLKMVKVKISWGEVLNVIVSEANNSAILCPQIDNHLLIPLSLDVFHSLVGLQDATSQRMAARSESIMGFEMVLWNETPSEIEFV